MSKLTYDQIKIKSFIYTRWHLKLSSLRGSCIDSLFSTHEKKWLYIKKRRKCPERKSIKFTRGSDSMNTNTSMTHYMSSRLDGIFIPSDQIFIDSQGGVKTITQLSCIYCETKKLQRFQKPFFPYLAPKPYFHSLGTSWHLFPRLTAAAYDSRALA